MANDEDLIPYIMFTTFVSAWYVAGGATSPNWTVFVLLFVNAWPIMGLCSPSMSITSIMQESAQLLLLDTWVLALVAAQEAAAAAAQEAKAAAARRSQFIQLGLERELEASRLEVARLREPRSFTRYDSWMLQRRGGW